MYGIADRDYILIDYGYRPAGISLIRKDRLKILCPVMIESAHDADLLLQEVMVQFENYNLCVIKFTQEEEAEMIIRKLQGI